MITRYTTMPSPIGTLLIMASGSGITRIAFPQEGIGVEPAWQRDDAGLASARSQLGEYFAGKRRTFELQLYPEGTQFQLAVWKALTLIPYGATASYGEIARRIGKPRASRAVGAANGKNPIPIIIPCHRVIGSDASLVGYGGGLDIKRFLLSLERDVTGILGALGPPGRRESAPAHRTGDTPD